MHRHRVARLHQPVHPPQLVARRMSGDMHQMIVVGHQPHAAAHQVVLHRADRPLVAGDHARGEDDRIALAQRDPRMVVARDARQRAARLALAAGDQDQQVVVGHVVDVVFGQERRQGLQIAAFTRGGIHVAQGAADQATLRPASCAASATDSIRATLLAKQVTATRPRQIADQRGQAGAHVLLAAGMALDHRVGRVADHRQHALLAQFGQRRLVGRRADQRRRDRASSRRCAARCPAGVSITSACASGIECAMRMKRSANGCRSIAAAGRDDVQADLVDQPHLTQLAAQHRGGERRGSRPGTSAAATARRRRRYDLRARG